MKHTMLVLCRTIEIIIIILSTIICIGYLESGHDNLEFAVKRIEGITGYMLNSNRSELILHKTNQSDSIVMVKDVHSVEIIRSQLDKLVISDNRWQNVQISESDAYEVISSLFSNSYQTDQHFRPVCEINRGEYDYLFYEKDEDDIKGCLVDVETGTIALYIYNH